MERCGVVRCAIGRTRGTEARNGAVEEAKSLGIPIVAICDTNVDPEGITFKIPSNDDAVGAIKLITGLVADAVLDGNQGSGVKHIFKDYLKMEIEKK